MLGDVQVVVIAAAEALAADGALEVEVSLALASVADHVLGVVEHLAAVPALAGAHVPVPLATVTPGQAWAMARRGGPRRRRRPCCGWGRVARDGAVRRGSCGRENIVA